MKADRIVFGACVAVIAAAIVAGQFDLVPERALCWSVILFAVECAGCGLTRSFAAMGRGDVQGAWMLNPLGPLLFLWIAALGATRLIRARRRADAVLLASVCIMFAARLAQFYLA